jgi:hypothetical protein
VQKYESGVRVPDLANMYSMSKSTISTILLVFLVNYAHYKTLIYYEKFMYWVLWEFRKAL